MANPQYDAVIVLGSKPNPTTWQFPLHVIATLDRAIGCYKTGQAAYIIVSGKWALSYDRLHITPPYKECDEMAAYLTKHGVPPEAILSEGLSMDTVSNMYYIKRQILKPKHLQKLL